MNTLWHDLRYAVRILLKQPGFTAIAVLALALSIGANTAIFSAVNALLLRPLPIEKIDQLVVAVSLREGFDPFGSALLEYAAYRDRSHCFSNSGLSNSRSFNLTNQTEPERVRGAAVMASYLTTLGVKPTLGRTFSAEEDQPGGPPVALIGYGFWQKHFNGQADAIDQPLQLNGRVYTVIGVMPPGFDLPGTSEIWVPLQLNIDALPLTERAATNNEIVARLRPGFTIQQADAELKGIARQLENEYPDFRRGWSVTVISMRQNLLGDLAGHVRKALFALTGGVGFLLLICCANIANLQLARGIAREREFAVRRALGAGSSRLVRQLLTETLVLAVLGGVAGVILANWLVPFLAVLNPIRGISFAAFFNNFELDRRVLAFALAVTVVTGFVCGVLPALKGARADELMSRMKQGDQRSGGIAAGRRWFKGLIVAEIAIALTLLIGGGLMVQSFQRLQHVDLGFSPDNLLTMKTVLPAANYPEYPRRVAFTEQLLERIRALPGVTKAGTTTNIPLDQDVSYDAIFQVEGRPPPKPGEVPITSHRLVSPEYLETIGVTLLRGRLIDKNDVVGRLPVVVVSEEFARQAWPGEDALGKRVRRVRAGQTFAWMTVIGVVKNVKEDVFNYRINRPVWYVPYAQMENDFPLSIVIRTSLEPASVIAGVRDAVRRLDPQQPVSDITTMNANISRVLVTERFGAVLMGALALSGLILASIGLYGVMAYSVSRRTGEIGLRVALGAQPRHVLGLILGSGVRLTLLGIAIGLMAAWGTTRLLGGLLFGLSATDATTFSAISFLLATIGLLASYFPARVAMRLNPIEALRYE